MKNLIKIITVFLFLGIVSCDYLDVVPNDMATLDHAFSNRTVTEKFLSTCYAGLPDPTDPFYYPAHFTSKDEFVCDMDPRSKVSVAGQIADGLQNTNNPFQNYWSGVNGGKHLYGAIRDCNIFLNNIHKPQDLESWERARWIAEVKFLKAYYHFFLMQLYGPIVIADEEMPLSASSEDLRVYREPVDDVVNYIVGLLDEAIPDLPLVLPDPASEMGRITQPIALAVKAKVLAWAASPLFNGNTDYQGWVDNRGKQLISDTYDVKKWERAATAIKNAIDTCHLAGFKLYEFNKYAGGAQTYNMNDTLVQMMTIRKAITEDIERNTGVIWATQEAFASSKGGAGALGFPGGNMLQALMPYMYGTDQPLIVSYLGASWHMAELFYTNKGVPMDEDKTFNYAGRFDVRRATPGDKHEFYIASGEITAEIHFNREPRFYADLAFDRGFMELASATTNGGASFSPFMRWRNGELQMNHVGVYSPKKIIAFETSNSKGISGEPYKPYDYRFPLIRLADLYLLYSEALNEIKDQPDNEVYHWIDLVREKAGLDGVVASWMNASTNPDKPFTKSGMREIIRRERLIELAFEGQRFWDVRRWKIADKYWSLPPTRWSFEFNKPEEFYVPEVYGPARQVTFRDYLYPLREYDIRVNANLVQTYGW
jgi:hypothetical protein